MRDWATRIAVAVLSLGLIQAGLIACCEPLEDLNTEARHCHSSPCPSHACCSPTIEIQAIAPQVWTTSDQTQAHASINANLPLSSRTSQSLLGMDSAPLNPVWAVPWPTGDLLVRIHVLLI